jgi:hypothetical protein
MTWKQIEASREARLWTTQVILPALGMATAVMVAVPEARKAVAAKADDVKNKIKKRLHK